VPISAHLQFVKFTVGDLDESVAFWSAVLNQRETARFQLGEGDDAVEEAILGPADGPGQSLLLLQYLRRPAPAPSGTVTGFGVSSIEEVVAAVGEAGGTVLSPPRAVGGVTVAVIADAAGHQVELVQQPAPVN
jgi:predicted enzyme related to lactoylglutathione lyase